jgi:hypothetical protein
MGKPKPRPSFRELLKQLLRRLKGEKEPPGDPYAYRLAPVRRGPKGRSGAAVAEPEEESHGFFPPRRQ